MESLRELYRIGFGPSASHTMGPRRAAEIFRGRNPEALAFRVTLFGSLAATGKGHLTDQALQQAFEPANLEVAWKPEEELPGHPNGMRFEALAADGRTASSWTAYSIGGGALREDGVADPAPSPYKLDSMNAIIGWTEQTGRPVSDYVFECEGEAVREHLRQVWNTMQESLQRGIRTSGVLPGVLHLPRKASSYYAKARLFDAEVRHTGLLSAYALGVSEENAAGGKVVTAPTCGSCGVLPAVLKYIQETQQATEDDILNALATAGIIGNLVKRNASISGAEVGCQGEIGTACAMAAGAAVQLLGGTPRQIEYAAEMGIEHHLGLTCDPVAGLVQIPCIERNAFAATRAWDCAGFALLSDGGHRISFDDVVATMKQTGEDLQRRYRETAEGGLAALYPNGVRQL